MDFSWIQKHILLAFVYTNARRVKDLRPLDMPANQFAYHLDGLVKLGLIEKTGRGTYQLSARGEQQVGTISTSTTRTHDNIKSVIMLYAKIDDKYLLYKWSRQPYIDKITPVYIRIPRGKMLDDALASAIEEKLGYSTELHYKQAVILRIEHEDVLISHMNAYVYEVSNLPHDFIYENRNGVSFLDNLSSASVMWGVGELFSKLENEHKPFETMLRY